MGGPADSSASNETLKEVQRSAVAHRARRPDPEEFGMVHCEIDTCLAR